jgi:hypothetical protein
VFQTEPEAIESLEFPVERLYLGRRQHIRLDIVEHALPVIGSAQWF